MVAKRWGSERAECGASRGLMVSRASDREVIASWWGGMGRGLPCQWTGKKDWITESGGIAQWWGSPRECNFEGRRGSGLEGQGGWSMRGEATEARAAGGQGPNRRK